MGRRDASALVACFHENYADLLRFLVRRTGDPERAADVAQDTYLRLATAPPPEGDLRNAQAYVYRVAGNLAVDTLRRDQRRMDRHTGSAPAETIPASDPSPEAVLLGRERLGLIDAALAELPPKARLALLLCRVDGLSHAEIAARLRISESMVAKYLAQALRHCRDRLRRSDEK